MKGEVTVPGRQKSLKKSVKAQSMSKFRKSKFKETDKPIEFKSNVAIDDGHDSPSQL